MTEQPERVAIVYGGRDQRIGQYHQADWLRAVLKQYAITTVRHGDCRGIDRDAGRIANQAGYKVDAMPADWSGERRRTGKAGPAGPKRNQAMTDKEPRPVLGIEFPGRGGVNRPRDGGTADMRRKLFRASVRVVFWADREPAANDPGGPPGTDVPWDA